MGKQVERGVHRDLAGEVRAVRGDGVRGGA